MHVSSQECDRGLDQWTSTRGGLPSSVGSMSGTAGPALGADVNTRVADAIEATEATGNPWSKSVSASGSGVKAVGEVSGAGGCRHRRLG